MRKYFDGIVLHKLRTRAVVAVTAVGLALGLAASASAATPTTPTSYIPGDCGGKQIVNITYGLYNDTDSGFYGNWATDSLNRHVKVFDLGNGMYCATVNDTGSFATTGPNSPESGVPLAAGISGVINGGYVTNDFTATPSSSPAYKTNGNLGSFDQSTGNYPSFLSYFNNPGLVNWTQPTWGWTYHTAQNGDWVNASSGSYGDISGS